MQPLATEFEDRTYRYRLVTRTGSYATYMRTGSYAIYRQEHKESAKAIRFEVIRIRVQPEHTWPNGAVSPERETYPGSAAWGRDGFTCFTLPEAESLLADLASRRAEEADDAQQAVTD
jgi:hypothetical protein